MYISRRSSTFSIALALFSEGFIKEKRNKLLHLYMKSLECQGTHRGKSEVEPVHGCLFQLIQMEIYLECDLQLNTNLYNKYLYLVSVLSVMDSKKGQEHSLQAVNNLEGDTNVKINSYMTIIKIIFNDIKVQRYHGGSRFKSLRVMEDFRKKVTRIVFS